ncbi:hypothetical protein K4K61_001797 [Colletotrichum sp. SAR11_59]|nr:hypothetical protein K4K61_001797 [Colletotrichum sp. SAR11_59]
MEMFWCGLSARFLDSFDDEPDPVTSLALKSIRRMGLRAFFEETMLGLGARDPKKMKDQEVPDEQIMNAFIKGKEELGSRPMAPARNDKSDIKHFRRITLCSDQWPDLAKAAEVACSSVNRLRAAIQGLKHRLEAENVPGRALASLLNSRVLDDRRVLETKGSLKAIADAFTARQTLPLRIEKPDIFAAFKEGVDHFTVSQLRRQLHEQPSRERTFHYLLYATAYYYQVTSHSGI